MDKNNFTYKLILAFTAIILIFNSCGYYVAFHFLQMNVKKEAKRFIANNEGVIRLTIITVHSEKSKQKNIIWYEDEKEFQLNNKMYDVVKKEIRGDSLYLHCFNDEKEENLLASFKSNIENDFDGLVNSMKRSKANLLRIFAFAGFDDHIVYQTFLPLTIVYKFNTDYFYKSRNIDVEHPPPNIY
ncbi:MAG: hypothetical protein WCT77_02795 [Bacteroidota bacterium]|jgi:hypothetical protein